MPQLDEATDQLLVRAAREPVRSVAATLTVAEGPDAGAVTRIELGTRRLLIGSSVACDVKLAVKGVSRRHAALDLDRVGHFA